jgi:tetratricopeptide (TPR) repeat protein
MYKHLAILLFLVAESCGCAFASTEQWIEVKSDHFTLITDGTSKQGRQIVDQFERMRWMFQALFPKAKVDPAEPIVILATRSHKSFDLLEPADYLAKGQMRIDGLFVKTQDKNYVLLSLDAGGDHPYTVVYHEYTHLQFSGNSDWMPLWLDEGLAEFVQNTEIREKDVRLGQPSVDDILFLRQNKLIPLPVLFKVDHASPYYHEEQKGSIFYAESWALTHYLEVNDNQKHVHQINDYMALLSHHEDPVDAAQKAFGDLKELQSSLEAYIRNGNYKEFILSSAAAPLHEESYRVRNLTQSEAGSVRADFLACVGREADSLTMLDAILNADPGNANALETKGYISLRDGDREEARKWYGAAVKAGSDSYLANYYFATFSMNAGGADQDAQIESSLRAAIRLNPSFAPPYDVLAVFLLQKHTRLEEAYMLSQHAVSLDRGNVGYRINASSILMAEGKYGDAVAVLTAASDLAKNTSEQTLLKNNLVAAKQMQNSGGHMTFVTAISDGTLDAATTERVADAEEKPKHPLEIANGPKHEAIGTLRHAQCSYPAILDLQLETPKKTLSLYSRNYYDLDLSALGFEPKKEMSPCKDLEGFKARVLYRESSDKTVDGQIVSVELRK